MASTSSDTTAGSALRSGRVRQADIARAAGVSQATVSIVLGHRDDGSARISEATRQHIVGVAHNLGYSVNPVARSLAGGRNRLLGVYTFEAVFPTADRDFYQEFLLGIEHEAEQVGYDLLLFTSASTAGRRSIYAGGVNRLALADGSILLGRQDEKTEVAKLASEGFPFVYIGRREVPGADLSYVGADYTAATDRVVHQLVQWGHRRIVYLADPRPREPELDRQAGWKTATLALGLSNAEATTLRPRTGANPVDRLLALHHDGRMTALILENPESARDLLGQIVGAGISVPQDLSVAVLGDDPSAVPCSSPWTGFRIPREAMGRQAVRLLIELLDDPRAGARHHDVGCGFAQGATAQALTGQQALTGTSKR